MCKVNVNRMKAHENGLTGIRVELTRMTAKSGTIVYAVLVKHCGRRYRIWRYETLGKAFEQFKRAAA